MMELDAEIIPYFSAAKWQEMGEYEKKRLRNVLDNYKKLQSLGLAFQKPTFMRYPQYMVDEDEDEDVSISVGKEAEPKNHTQEEERVWVPSKKKRKKGVNFNPPSQRKERPKMAGKSPPPVIIVSLENTLVQDMDVQTLSEDSSESVHGFLQTDIKRSCTSSILLTECKEELFKDHKPTEQDKNTDKEKASAPRYPKRNIERKNYTEGPVPDDDDYIFCDECDREWEGDCPKHGALVYIKDTEVPEDPNDPEWAEKTVPYCLSVAPSSIPGAGEGVWTTLPVDKGTKFGPYRGALVHKSNKSGYCWQISRNRRTSHCVDARDKAVSNWMRFVNCARYEEEQNLLAFQYKGEMYYRTYKKIPPHVELLVWYGDEYGKELGVDIKAFRENSPKQMKSVAFPCQHCETAFTSPLFLEKHVKYCRGLRRAQLAKIPPAVVGSRPPETAETDPDAEGRRRLPLSVRETGGRGPAKRGGERARECLDCGATFRSNGELVRHRRTHTGERPYECLVCHMKFSHKNSLVNHSRVHTGDKPFHCLVCHMKFARNDNLVTHKRIHTGERPYQCLVCDAKFTQNSHLVEHSRIHTGDKPFHCLVCHMKFSHKTSLVNHSRVHTGDKPFHCLVCHLKFARNDSLVTHKRIHTGERPYGCAMCGATFSQKRGLVRHSRAHS